MKEYKHALPLYLVIVTFLITVFADPAAADAKVISKSGRIQGRVLDTVTGEPIIGTSVLLTNKFGGAMADTAGTYVISRLSPGRYDLRFSHVKYETRLIEGVKVDTGEAVVLDVQMVERPVLLKTVTVTPGRFSIMGTEAAARQSLTRQEIETMPQLGDDFFRAISRLPGVSANDFSTRFTVRGGEYEEVLVTFDGLRLYEPFHLKDFDGGAMSIVDVAAVEGIDLMTGGFPANDGDKTSGVFNITSRRPRSDNKRLSLGLSFLNARFASEGTFANNRGSWIVSARRGYIDLVFKLTGADDNIKPSYYDVFAKTRYQLNRNHVFSANILHAGDDLHLYGEGEDAGDTLKSKYDNSYAWLTLHSALAPDLTVRTVGSVGRVTHGRYGQILMTSIQEPTLIASDEEVFWYAGLKTDWEWEVGKNYLLKFGVEGKTAMADYDYHSRVFDYRYETVADTLAIVLDKIDSNIVDLDLSGRKLGAYVSNRFRLAEPLTTEIGLRYDYTSYSGDECWSPRLNLVYNLGPGTTIRTGWGYYYQTQQLDDLKVGDRQTEFFPAVRAEHRVIGFEHSFSAGMDLRMEAYYKKYTDPWPSFRNTFDPIEAFPELESDRTIVYRENTVSKGIEVFVKKDTGGKIAWWVS